jgi:anionic cell wall polymer biosynthesis LytR-Cps2A-Psr (LCP) family protein
MSLGARVPGSKTWNMAQGFQLVSQTVRNYTGIDDFDAAVLIGFGGLTDFVDAVGGIDIYVDHRVASIHRQPDGHHRKACSSCANGYGGPQMVYEVGMRHLNGWQTLDYARQRYGLPDGAYSRERHHRQIVVAMIAALYRKDLVLDPKGFQNVLSTVGDGLVFDGRGRRPTDYGYALRNIAPEDITLIGLPGSAVYSNGSYVGESLNQGLKNAYFQALRNDTLDQFVAANPNLVNRTGP